MVRSKSDRPISFFFFFFKKKLNQMVRSKSDRQFLKKKNGQIEKLKLSCNGHQELHFILLISLRLRL